MKLLWEVVKLLWRTQKFCISKSRFLLKTVRQNSCWLQQGILCDFRKTFRKKMGTLDVFKLFCNTLHIEFFLQKALGTYYLHSYRTITTQNKQLISVLWYFIACKLDLKSYKPLASFCSGWKVRNEKNFGKLFAAHKKSRLSFMSGVSVKSCEPAKLKVWWNVLH